MKPKNTHRDAKLGHCFVHTVINGYPRGAYNEMHDDEKSVTAASVLERAPAWSVDRRITIERVISDNGSAYRARLWRDTYTSLNITPKGARPCRPQTNGKIERFHRTLTDGCPHVPHYSSEQERRGALGR